MSIMRAAMGRNPLQSSLIDSASMPIFGEAVAQQEAQRLEGQQRRVEALMADGFWHTLPQLQKELRRCYGQLYSETSISARLRAMRKRGYTVEHARTRIGSNLYQYRACKNGPQAEARERERTSSVLASFRTEVIA
jgi:hypothetical protein